MNEYIDDYYEDSLFRLLAKIYFLVCLLYQCNLLKHLFSALESLVVIVLNY